MTSSVSIVGIGARNPLGLLAVPAAAAVRAGVRMLAQHPFLVDQVGDLMPAALDPQLDPRIIGPERLLVLAESASREACGPLVSARAAQLRLPVFLGLSEIRPGFGEPDAEAVRAGMMRLKDLPVGLSKVI